MSLVEDCNGNGYTFELDLRWEEKRSFHNQIAVKMFGSVAAWSVSRAVSLKLLEDSFSFHMLLIIPASLFQPLVNPIANKARNSRASDSF